MRRVAFVTAFLLACPIALAQHFHHGAISGPDRGSPCLKKFAPPPALTADDLKKIVLWRVNWPVTTSNQTAQYFFNLGITEYFAFDYEEAMRYFRAASAADPKMPMAPWGIALAAGPNINLGMDAGCRQVAMDESAHARELAAATHLTGVEYGLIDALPLRYAGPLTETVAYTVAMRKVWQSVTDANATGPNGANVGALFAESLLELRPWGLFDSAYREALDTRAILDVLRVAKEAEPNSAIGANHYWIHAVEASAKPDTALASADLLSKLMSPPLEAPGHLVHMPSHIYFLLGQYERARKSNEDAVHADEAQYGNACKGNFEAYSKNDLCPQLYYGHYLSHNYFFRCVSATFSGNRTEALTAADGTRDTAKRFVANEPGLQRYMTAPLMVRVMNRDWDAIEKEQEPLPTCDMQPFEANG